MLKPFLAILSGIVAGFLVVMAADFAAQILYPPPAGFNFEDKNAIREMSKNLIA